MIKKKIPTFLALCISISSLSLAISFITTPKVLAADLISLSTELSNNKTNATNVNYSFSAETATTSIIKRINIQFSTIQGETTKPGGLNLENTLLNSTSNLGSGWQIGTTNHIYGLITITKDTAIELTSNTTFSFELGAITNSAMNDCEPSNDVLLDTCHIKVTTFSDNGGTAIDVGMSTYTLNEDPYSEFNVEAINSGTTQNEITASKTSEVSLLNFGSLQIDSPVYLSQKIKVRTNAPRGYKLYAVFQDKFFGTAYNDTEIDPFGATDATWDTPKAWENPDGITPNQNTGWIGLNTSDNTVTNWGGGAGKFAPTSTNKRLISQSSTPQTTTKEFYVSFVVGINSLQPGDQYRTNLTYQIEPIY